MNLDNEKISSGVAQILLGQSIIFAVSSLIHSFIAEDNIKWFSRWELSMILLGFYGIIKAIQSLKKDK